MNRAQKRFIPISLKLSLMILLILAAATAPIIFESSNYLEKVSYEREEQHLVEKLVAKTEAVETLLWGYIDLLEDNARRLSVSKRERTQTFSMKEDLHGLQIWDADRFEVLATAMNSQTQQSKNGILKYSNDLKSKRMDSFQLARQGQYVVKNEKINGRPFLILAVPIRERTRDSQQNRIAIGYFNIDRMLGMVKKQWGTNVLILDHDYKVVAHYDEKLFMSPQVYERLKSRAGQGHEEQFGSYITDKATDNERIVAWYKTPQNVFVVAETPTSFVQIPIIKVKMRSIYIAVTVFAIALTLVFLFSRTITGPIEKLFALTQQVAKGNFSVRSPKSILGNDELGELAVAFDAMTAELEKGHKVRSAFTKFHGNEVAEELIKKELKRGGVRREATVLFCDIRNFTVISESSAPEDVVKFLNDYFQAMVSVIRSNKGTVDKFIGDGIMAVWGLQTHSPQNPQLATKAALEMRIALKKLNAERVRQGLQHLEIGIGIHRGPVVAGIIGSEERMEFTVVGDTVNTASRIEQATKEMHVDLLISGSVAEALDEKFILRRAGSIQLKGKSMIVPIAEVEGYFDRNNKPIYVKSASHFNRKSA